MNFVPGEVVVVARLCNHPSCGCVLPKYLDIEGVIDRVDSPREPYEVARIVFKSTSRWFHTDCLEPVITIPDGTWMD